MTVNLQTPIRDFTQGPAPGQNMLDFKRDLTPAQKYMLTRINVMSAVKMYMMYHLDLKLPVKRMTPPVDINDTFDPFHPFHMISLK